MPVQPPGQIKTHKGRQNTTPIIGAGVMGHNDFRPTLQFCGDHVGRQEAVGMMLSGDYSVYYCVMHGCTLQDGIYYTITRMEGAKIYELDGQPIVSIIDEIYGNPKWQKQIPLKRLAIGVNYGEAFGDFKEANYVNRLITGYSIEEVNRLGWYQSVCLDPEVQQRAVERTAKMREGEDIVAEEWVVTTKDGNKKALSISTSILRKDNNTVHVLALMQDFSERKKVFEALRKIRERYDLATIGGKVGVWDWNLRTGEIFVSSNLKALLGYDDEEIENRIEDWGRHVYAEDVETGNKEANACIEGLKKDYHVEHRMCQKDGSLRWFLASGKIEWDEHGKAVRLVGTDTDITDTKHLEEQLQQSRKMEAIGTLAGNDTDHHRYPTEYFLRDLDDPGGSDRGQSGAY